MKAFEALSDGARLWIYQSDRLLKAHEQEWILGKLGAFLSEWAAHGQDLSASANILHDHFIVIAVDESFNLASGCSIDQSVQLMKKVGEHFNIDFFNRANIAFMLDGQVTLIPMSALKTHIEKGSLNENTSFFQNTIQTKKELKSNWLIKAGESWLKKYFQKAINV